MKTGSESEASELFEHASKALAVVVAVVYVCGFLITSIHDFQYGFSELNPFRPRILTAGAWFAIFLAIPFALLRSLMRSKEAQKPEASRLTRIINLSWAYIISCNFILFVAKPVFSFDPDQTSPAPHPHLAYLILGFLGLLGFIALVIHFDERIPKWLFSLLTAALVANIFWGAFQEFYLRDHFKSSALILWLLCVGALFAFELTLRSWKPTLGDWPQSFAGLLALVAIFATRYYPHILSSWGGGVPIPVTISFTKDAVSHPAQELSFSLIDETDAGFYVTEGAGRAALFIPRASVGLVRFSRPNEH